MPGLATRVGRVIRKHRVGVGLSQEALASEAGLHRTYISLVERGQRNLSVGALAQIAEALGTYPSRLLAEAETEGGASEPSRRVPTVGYGRGGRGARP